MASVCLYVYLFIVKDLGIKCLADWGSVALLVKHKSDDDILVLFIILAEIPFVFVAIIRETQQQKGHYNWRQMSNCVVLHSVRQHSATPHFRDAN